MACSGGPLGDGAGKSFDGNPATRPTPGFSEIEVRPATSVQSSPAQLKNLQLQDGITQILEVRLFVKNLELLDLGVPQFNLDGPNVVRLVQDRAIVDQALPPFGGAVVANGSYHQFELSFERLTPENLPAEASDDSVVNGPLIDHSMVVEGTVGVPGTLGLSLVQVPFRFQSNQLATIQIDTSNPFALSGEYTTLFIAFEIQNWLDPSIVQDILGLDPAILLGSLLVLDTESAIPELREIALRIQANINASLRFAPSADATFDESELDLGSSSTVIFQ